MCGRYYIQEDCVPEAFATILDEAIRKFADGEAPDIKTSGEIFPSELVPVVATNRKRAPSAFPMRWGYTRAEGTGLIINARSETASRQPMFRDGMLARRCLVPASRYFEWEKRGKARVRYELAPEGERAFYMAGIYRMEDATAHFAILTRAAAPHIAFIHERMPVLLSTRFATAWLGDEDGEALLREANQSVVYRRADA